MSCLELSSKGTGLTAPWESSGQGLGQMLSQPLSRGKALIGCLLPEELQGAESDPETGAGAGATPVLRRLCRHKPSVARSSTTVVAPAPVRGHLRWNHIAKIIQDPKEK